MIMAINIVSFLALAFFVCIVIKFLILIFYSIYKERKEGICKNQKGCDHAYDIRVMFCIFPWLIFKDFPEDFREYSGEKGAKLAELDFQNASDNIEYAKRNQWRAAYYLILLYAGIIGVDNLKQIGNDNFEKWFLWIVALLTWVFYWWVLRGSQKSLAEQRMKMKGSAEAFSPRSARNNFRCDFGSYRENIEYSTALLTAGFIAFFVLTYVLFKEKTACEVLSWAAYLIGLYCA